MAKRSTIGENPLDLLVSQNSLDTVVPGPEAASRATRLDERLDRLEAGIGEVQAEVAGVKKLTAGKPPGPGRDGPITERVGQDEGGTGTADGRHPATAGGTGAAEDRSGRAEGGSGPTPFPADPLGHPLVDGQKEIGEGNNRIVNVVVMPR